MAKLGRFVCAGGFFVFTAVAIYARFVNSSDIYLWSGIAFFCLLVHYLLREEYILFAVILAFGASWPLFLSRHSWLTVIALILLGTAIGYYEWYNYRVSLRSYQMVSDKWIAEHKQNTFHG